MLKHVISDICNSTGCNWISDLKVEDMLYASSFFYTNIRFTLKIPLKEGESLNAMTIWASGNTHFKIFLEDKATYAIRKLRENLEKADGGIVFDKQHSYMREYSVSFRHYFVNYLFRITFCFNSQIHLTPEDLNHNCTFYDEEETYAACDTAFIRDSLPQDLIPLWSLPLSNLSSASTYWFHNDSSYMTNVYRKLSSFER